MSRESQPALTASEVRQLLDDGQPLDAAAVLAQHPEFSRDKSLVLDLIYEEYCQRREAGEAPTPDEFCRRFPRFQSSLRRLLHAHDFLQDNPDLLAGGQPSPWPQAGEQFLGFELLRELGRGSFARVFLAEEPALGARRVAIKVSRQGAAEAQTLGRLEHPSVVPVYSVQVDDRTGLIVICMPYLGSCTLCDILDRVIGLGGPPRSAAVIGEALEAVRLPGEYLSAGSREKKRGYLEAVVQIAAEIAEALAFVHAQGIFHRDLKPSNVLLTADGRPMLLDFNLSFDRLAQSNQFGGTLPYMAPEHIKATDPSQPGDPSVVDARSDLFSLGVILYELLAGHYPFGDDFLQKSLHEARRQLLEHQHRGPRPVQEVNPAVDRRLARIVHRCLAYDPAKRPQGAAELATELRRNLSAGRRLRRWVARHRLATVTAALAVWLGIAWGIYGWSMQEPYSVRQWRYGLVRYRQNNDAEAVQCFTRALEAEPSSAAILFSRGRAYQRQKNWRLAFIDFEAAYKLADDGPTEACLADCLCHLTAYQEAAVYFRRAIAKSFESAEVFNDLGYCSLQLGKLEEARAALDRAIVLDPGLQAPYYNRAMLHMRIALARPGTDFQTGLADFRRALEIGPETTDLLWSAAILAAEAGQSDLALQRVRRSLELGQDPRRLKTDRGLRALFADPRFQALRRNTVSPAAGKPSRAVRVLDPLARLPL